ncbi:MAG: hypothetical protein PSX81_08560 [bacterium]|nr:hypothetical protein [bacterium]
MIYVSSGNLNNTWGIYFQNGKGTANTIKNNTFNNLYVSTFLNFSEYMDLITDYAETNYNDTWLLNNFTTLKTIADDTTHFMAAKAKVLVQFVIDLDTNNIYHDSILYPYLHHDLSMCDSNNSIDNNIDLIVYPNPFNTIINLEITNNNVLNTKYINVLVQNFDGNTVLSDSFSILANSTIYPNFDSSALYANSFYVLKIIEGVNTVKYKLIFKE